MLNQACCYLHVRVYYKNQYLPVIWLAWNFSASNSQFLKHLTDWVGCISIAILDTFEFIFVKHGFKISYNVVRSINRTKAVVFFPATD